MSRYPNFPGYKGGDTSEAAAQAMALHLGRLQNIALIAIIAAGERGLTKEEVASATGFSEKAIGPRVSELATKDLVKDSGKRRPNETSKMAKVWVAVAGAQDAICPLKPAPIEKPDATQCEAS